MFSPIKYATVQLDMFAAHLDRMADGQSGSDIVSAENQALLL